MPVTQHGWSTTVEADLYFTDERPVKALWAALLVDFDLKNTVLNNAYNRLFYDPDYSSLPAKGAETVAQKVVLIKAQSEMAYYILMHLEDEDRRKGIQVQGAVNFGIIKESYNKDMSDVVPIPPIVKALLAGYYEPTSPFYSVNIDRDENESVDEDVTDF